jgi:hypothetical protein
MTKPGARTWAIALAAALAAVVAVLIALPFAVRYLVIQRVEAMTGRRVVIRDVDANPFTGRVAFHDVRVESPQGAPLAAAPRIEAQVRLGPLLGGGMHLAQLTLVEPAVFVSRTAEGRVSVEDVIERWTARESGEPAQVVLERLSVERGRVTFADYAISPDRRWSVENIAIDARDIATTADAAAGRASVQFVVGDAPAALDIDDLHVRPLRFRAAVNVEGLNVAPFSAYAGPDAPMRVARGRVTGRATVQYDAGGFIQASADNAVRGLVLVRPGKASPFVEVPEATLSARRITFTDRPAAGLLTVATGEVVVYDAGAARAAPLRVRDVRFRYADRVVSAAGPGDVTLTAKLPGDATLEARGTGAIAPFSAAVHVELRRADLALAQRWLPRDAALIPAAGEVGASLNVRYAAAPGLAVGGRAWIEGFAMARRDEPGPFIRDDRVEIDARDVRVDEAGLNLGHVALVASPTVSVRRGSDPLEVPSLRLTAAGGGGRDNAPAQLTARLELPGGGVVTADGEARLDAASARFTATATGVDALLAAPYLPTDAPLRVSNGRVDARLSGSWSGTLAMDGDVTIRQLTLQRAGQDAPLVEHATLAISLRDARADASGMSLAQATITGAPVITDATASPPQRYEMRALQLVARDLTWPGRQAIALQGHAEEAGGGRAELRGTLHPSTLATDVRVEFDDVRLRRVDGYLGDDGPLAIDDGRAAGAVRLRYVRGGPVRLDGEAAVSDVAVVLTGSGTRIRDERATFSFSDLVIDDGGVTVGRAAVDASPEVGRGGEEGEPFGLHAEVRALAWPQGGPADVTLVGTPGDGRVELTGTFTPSTRAVELVVHARAAALFPFTALIPIDASVAGVLDADGRVALHPRDHGLTASGDLVIRDVRVGPAETAPMRVAELRVEEFALDGATLAIERVTVTRPSVLVEREKDGSFPLRAMLTPDASGAASPAASPAAGGVSTGGARHPESREARAWRITVDDIRVVDGNVRFLDRTTTPFYSEEVTSLAVTLRDVSNAGNDRAGLMVQGIVGTDASLDLRGEVAPFATPFYLEVSGELRDFAVPRTNPYLDRFLDWIARRGQLTTRVQYRIVGNEVQATNELIVHRLDVARARDDAKAERAIGLPLGLVVALLKDARGDIRFTLPVSGELGSPTFSFGDAIRSALTNVLGRLITAPLRAIGSIVRRDGRVEAVGVDPVEFAPGSAALTPEASAQLQRVADFMRASPYVDLVLQGLASERDVQALRARAVVARIQREQREQRLDDFATAARRVWTASMPPGSEPPADPQGIVRVLTAREPAPSDEARALADRRRVVAHAHLVDAAGIPRDRVIDAPGAPQVGVDGAGRVEFELRPRS